MDACMYGEPFDKPEPPLLEFVVLAFVVVGVAAVVVVAIFDVSVVSSIGDHGDMVMVMQTHVLFRLQNK